MAEPAIITGAELRRRRLACGQGYKAISQYLGLGRSTWADWEAGRGRIPEEVELATAALAGGYDPGDRPSRSTRAGRHPGEWFPRRGEG
jgi:transcriptional regulator with XRE-family HTH domain